MGFHYQISVDLDEYAYPLQENITLVDAIDEMFLKYPSRGVFYVDRYQFNSQPHILEPLDELVIEAYQFRYETINEFSPSKGVQSKTIFSLRNPRYSNSTTKFVLECCSFHSCKHGPIDDICPSLYKAEINNVLNAPWPKSPFVINHYARSLEKFYTKQRSWKFDKNDKRITNFMDRSYGNRMDNVVATRYSCLTRKILLKITGKADFVRYGTWMKTYPAEKKRGRKKSLKITKFNEPTEQHSKKQRITSLAHSS